MNITLCDKVLDGDIPSYQFDEKEKGIDFIYEWLKTIKITFRPTGLE